jgi:DNA invertase Pin-like site-specific DNA recombinase
MEQTKQTAVIYARVSSQNDRQDTTRQVQDLKKYAESQNLTILKTFEEHISGAKKIEERQILSECMEYCTSHSAFYVKIQTISRLFLIMLSIC